MQSKKMDFIIWIKFQARLKIYKKIREMTNNVDFDNI